MYMYADSLGGFTNGASSQPIWLDNVQCTGEELSLLDCRANPIGVHSCNHFEDAGIICSEGLSC